MSYLPPETYVKRRQRYGYSDSKVEFVVVQTGNLPYFGSFHGIFPTEIPAGHTTGVNMRKFEAICASVFADCIVARQHGDLSQIHIDNLKNVICAVVHWKMASQGGRSQLKVENVKSKWTNESPSKLLDAYQRANLSGFRIGGIRIPTATAIMRFSFPTRFGTMDSRVVGSHTQPRGITTLGLRDDGYITDTRANIDKYYTQYMPFLSSEAIILNTGNFTFADFDANGNGFQSRFRPCDIEMALFTAES